MKTIEWKAPEGHDFRSLPAGPWTDEPDKRQWRDKETSLACLVVRGQTGALCGYVGVDGKHPAYGLDYDSEELGSIQVHGGLTYSDTCCEENRLLGVCHEVEPGEDDGIWWLGFDCSHAWDLAPNFMVAGLNQPGSTYKDLAYVTREVERLAQQLREMETG